MDNEKVMNDQELGEVAGGNGYDYVHDLSLFVTRTVCNVVRWDDSACLTFRRSPEGSIIPGIGYQNGDPILVHSTYREAGLVLCLRPRDPEVWVRQPQQREVNA